MDSRIMNTAIKNEIDTVCRDLLMENVGEYISAPVILALFLGGETYDVVNASLKDAFTTSFKIGPNVYDICIPDAGTDSNFIVEKTVDAIRSLYDQGKDYSDLRIVFIGLMDDPFFNEESPALVSAVRDALVQLSNYGISSMNQTSFYGLFRQSKMRDTDYRYAFAFVNAGKDIWQNINHIEAAIFARDMRLHAQLMAINILSDTYSMHQEAGGAEYRWKSLYLHYLKMPELIVTRVLREIYAGQVSGRNLDYEKWGENIKEELNKMLGQLYEKPEYDCEQYIPLCFYDYPEERPAEGRGLFGRKTAEACAPVYTRIIMDKSSFDQLLEELYGAISLTEEDYEEIIEKIISSATSIDQDSNKISQFVSDTLKTMLDEYTARMENLKANARLAEENSSGQVNSYLKKVYETRTKIFLIKKKIQIVGELTVQLTSGVALPRAIREIIRKNKQYTDILDELSKNEYGGTLEHFNVPNLLEFKVNQPVVEILKEVDRNLLYQIMSDENIVHQKLQKFLGGVAANVAGKHNLGEINGEYNQIEPVISALLMIPSLGRDSEIMEMVNRFGGLYIKTSELYRENTFYIISSREYASDKYIIRYKRG